VRRVRGTLTPDPGPTSPKVQEEALTLGSQLLAARDGAPPARKGPDRSIEVRLEGILASCRLAWPDVSLPDDAFVAFLGARLPPTEPLDTALASAQAEDLFLACACLRGDPRALEAFDRLYLAHVPSFLSSLRESDGFLEEAAQVLRERLLVGHGGGGPQLAEYAGRGSLQGWLRVTSVRCALNLRESEKRHRPSDTPLEPEMLGVEGDPELAYLKARYRTEFEAAFKAAMRSISARDRSLLRFYVVDRLNIEQIGAIHGVHRATVARWIADTRRRILEEAHRQIRDRLNVSGTELESLQRLVRSQLDVSIAGILGST
jgi:RNA polymerase sigma-70 factor (ECF subfamily)